MSTEPSSGCPVRLANLSPAAKLTLTLFLALIGIGYLVAAGKIYVWHNEADGVPGMSPDDLRAVYHGLEKEVTEEIRATLKSDMLEQVSPEGQMRRHLEKGGEAAVHALVAWLEDGAPEAKFARPAAYAADEPSAKQVIEDRCILCHNADGGDKSDVPYAASEDAEAEFALVIREAAPPVADPKQTTVTIGPVGFRELLHVTHAHILSIPVFTLAVSALFLLTGLSSRIKLLVAPLPMAATCLDFACWWLARPFEPAIFGILLAGAVFGASLGFQILAVLGSMWLGRRTSPKEP